MDAIAPTSYVPLGAMELAVATPGRAFVAGGMLILYQDPETWETVAIESVAADHIHLASPTSRGWEVAHTLCVPVALCRLLDAPELRRIGGPVAAVEAAFSVEPDTAPLAASTGAVGGTQYEGVDVLTEAQHNTRDSISEAFTRIGTMIENPTGRREYDDQGQRPFPGRNFLWTARDRAACVALREFLDARHGRQVPFWTPTFAWDLALAEDSSGAGATLVIRKAGYGQFLWGSLARRRLAVFAPGQPMLIRRVTGLTDGETTETITLNTPPGVPLPAATTRICFLVLCRLEADQTDLTWKHSGHCEAAIHFRELPNEVPA
jgi:hypothetical protein